MFSVLPLQVTPRTAALSSIKCVQTRRSVRNQAMLLVCIVLKNTTEAVLLRTYQTRKC